MEFKRIEFLKDVIVNGDLTVQGTSYSESAEQILTKGALTVINAENNDLDLTLMGTVIRTGKKDSNNNDIDYAIIYDPLNEAVRLGTGTYNSETNTYAFSEGDGNPIATRDLTIEDDGTLVMWDAKNYCLVSGVLKTGKGKYSVEQVTNTDNQNSAIGNNSVAVGAGNTAGSHAFGITEVDINTNVLTLSSIDGLEEGMPYVYKADNDSEVSGNIISVGAPWGTYAVKGVWTWNKQILYTGTEYRMLRENVNFKCNDEQFYSIRVEQTYNPDSPEAHQYVNSIWYAQEGQYYEHPYYCGALFNEWSDYYGDPSEVYRTIDFGPSPQAVSEEFYNYLIENAVPEVAPLYRVRGTWRWNELLAPQTFEQKVNFTSNGEHFAGIKRDNLYAFYGRWEVLYPDPDLVVSYGMPWYGAYEPEKWNDWNGLGDTYRTIDFGLVPQEVSEEFYNYLMINATEVDTYTLSGTWVWKESPNCYSINNLSITDQLINFISGGKQFFGIRVSRAYDEHAPTEYKDLRRYPNIFYGYALNDSSGNPDGTIGYGMPYCGALDPNKWNDEWPHFSDKYRTVDFGSEPQAVSAEFYEYFIDNAAPIGDNSSNQITVDNTAKVSDGRLRITGRPDLGDLLDGEGAFAEGKANLAQATYSHASGLGTIAVSEAQTAIGKYNKEDLDALFIVGNGISSANRNNAFVVKADGTAYINGEQIAVVEAEADDTKYLNFVLASDAQSYEVSGPAVSIDELPEKLVIPATYKGKAVTGIRGSAFGAAKIKSIELPDSITNIWAGAFNNCTELETIVLSNSLTSISSGMFWYCRKLKTIKIPEGVLSIESMAFEGCSALENVEIPSSVTNIEYRAFAECTSLKNIVIPDSVESIGSETFKTCSQLESITLPFIGATKDGTENTYFGYIFGASKSSENSTFVPSSLRTVVLTGGELDQFAFYKCYDLVRVVLPNSLTSIGVYAFYDCRCLAELEIPNTVTRIGGFAFSSCQSLTSINIPDGVTYIGPYAFESCESLTNIVIPISTTEVQNQAFDKCTNLTIYCEASIQPTSWDNSWNSDDRPVVWNFASNFVDVHEKLEQAREVSQTLDQKIDELKTADPVQMVFTTWVELVGLRDSGKLIPGMFYRITDYQCTTSQPETRAVDNKFDIIVQALDSNTLSENAKTGYHKEYMWPRTATILPGFIADEDNELLIVDSVIPYYYEYVDEDTSLSEYEEKTSDVFIAYGYGYNNDRIEVPMIFKTDRAGIDPESQDYNAEFAGPDYNDAFYYVGRATIEGETYDKWRKIELSGDSESLYSWESDTKVYIYTNIITEHTEANGMVGIITGIQPEDANIPAWEIKYCLDNDTSRFAWAKTHQILAVSNYNFDPLVRYPALDGKEPDGTAYQIAWGNPALYTEYEDAGNDPTYLVYSLTETVEPGDELYYASEQLTVTEVTSEGKGVIYYMKDEWNNECPYDFKNIQYKRPISVKDNVITYDPDNGEDTWVYTFTAYNVDNAEYLDASIVNGRDKIDDSTQRCCNNTISISQGRRTGLGDTQLRLNDNVFLNSFSLENDQYFDCSSNTFGANCYSNTFGDCCYSNTFETHCHSNTFGANCYFNIFGNYCYSNTFEYGCSSNTFGANCYSNTFGTNCYSNTFGTHCYSNTFGNSCNYNTFRYQCDSNTFENSCNYNTFGNNCSSNTFGNRCDSNTFGNDCKFNDLSNYDILVDVGGPSTRDQGVRNINFASACNYIKIVNGNLQSKYVIQNITICQGVTGTEETPLKLRFEGEVPPRVYEAAGTTHIILD